MADINIERKGGGGSSIIPWIIGLLVLALLAWWLLAGRGGDEPDDAVVVDTSMDAGMMVEPMPADTMMGATGGFGADTALGTPP
jgi:hypothetical protein